MFGSKVEKAKSDWPVDKVNVKKCHVDIDGRYPSPNHENRVAGFTALIVVPGLFIMWPVALGLAIPLGWAFWSMLKRRLNIRIRPDVISINGKRYALDGIREFRVEPHERAYESNPGLYERALEVVMQYGEKRISIAEMRHQEKEKAVALGLRLQEWVEKFEQMMSHVRQPATQEAAPVRGDFGPEPDIR